MKIGARSFRRRSVLLAAAGILAVVLTACTGRGGGQLPPQPLFKAPASFGFTFSCEDSGGINQQTGQLRIQLSYTERGTSPLLGAPFSIHGIVDKLDPVLESAICSGEYTPPEPLPPNELIFLGRYRLTSSAPPGFPPSCPTRETSTSPLCRFEVEVHDNDKNLAPSEGDFFSIQLSSSTFLDCENPPPNPPLACSQLVPGTVFYARAGTLSSGNLTVD
jgi:hypothetical protein